MIVKKYGQSWNIRRKITMDLYNKNGVVPYIQGYPNTACQQSQSIIPNQFIPSAETQEYLYRHNMISEQNAQIEIAKMGIHHQYKMEEAAFKAQLAEKRDEANARRKINSENAVIAVFEDVDGYLRIQTKFPDGNSSYSQPIFKYANIHFMRLVSNKDNTALDAIFWMEEKQEKLIFLKGEKRNSKYLLKEMERQGNPILVGRDRKKQIGDLVYGFLVDHGSTDRIPEHYGWNKEGNSWFFVSEGQFTLEKYEKGDVIKWKKSFY